MYARDFYPMMDYRATANCSTLFLFFPRRKNSDLVRDRRCGILAFFLSLNVNTHRLWQNYRALYDPFYELNIFSSLVCGAVKHVDRNNIVRGYVYTRISAFSFFVSAATRKIRCGGRGRRYRCILRLYSFFFLFRIFARSKVARVSILDRNKVAVSRNLFASFPRWKFESRGNIFPPLVPGYARLQTRSSRVV